MAVHSPTSLTSAPSGPEAISTRSPIAWVKPLPGPCRSCVGENMVPRNSMQPSGYWWCAPRVWRTRSSGSRLIWLIRFTPASEKPSGPSMRSATSAARTLSRVKSASNSRMKGPMAQEPLLSLARVSSSALRPSTSRRLTSLPSVAPTIWPRLSTASTSSGSGLFQRDSGSTPMRAP